MISPLPDPAGLVFLQLEEAVANYRLFVVRSLSTYGFLVGILGFQLLDPTSDVEYFWLLQDIRFDFCRQFTGKSTFVESLKTLEVLDVIRLFFLAQNGRDCIDR